MTPALDFRDFQKVLVTGAAGFIGSSLVDRLLGLGKTVVGLDNFDPFYDPERKRQNLEHAHRQPGFRLIEGDILDQPLLERLFAEQDFDVVVHLAAKAGVRPSLEDPAAYFRHNVEGTLSLLQVIKHRPATRLVMASSSSVYGNLTQAPFRESAETSRAVSPYAASKKAGEVMTHTFHHLYGIPTTLLRFFTVYGPRQRPEMAIAKFVRMVREGKTIPMFGNGETARDYTYIDDIVEGIVRAVGCCSGYRIYNLGNSTPVKLSDMIAAVGRACGREPKLEAQEDQPGDVELTYADVHAAAEELGYAPRTSLEEGLKRYLAWETGRDEDRQGEAAS